MNKWIYVKNDLDVKEFSNYFYDACLKELWYESGMYVDCSHSMQPVNNKRNLHIIFQNQSKIKNVIEVVFEQVDTFCINPKDMDYDGVINGIYMILKDEKIIWFDVENYFDDYRKLYDYATWVKASNVKYRFLDSSLGEDSIYIIDNRIFRSND